MENLIVVGILLVLVGAAVHCIWREWKNGKRCIGCSSSCHCSKKECQNRKES